MLYAKNGMLKLGDNTMDYISFGSGGEKLVILPGLGDGLKTVKGTALPFAFMYKDYAVQYTVYVFSRINELTPGYTTKDMARDVSLAMDELEIRTASVMGVSQGGMIAQYFALDYPERVEKIVLAVTLAKQNSSIQNVVSAWIEMAKQRDYKRLMADTAEKTYSDEYLRKNRLLIPLSGLLGKPSDFSRFIIQAESCLNHNAFERLDEIKCPTLILGGRKDKIVGAMASGEISSRITSSELFVYEGLGHGAYEEAKDFNRRVLSFLG